MFSHLVLKVAITDGLQIVKRCQRVGELLNLKLYKKYFKLQCNEIQNVQHKSVEEKKIDILCLFFF